MVNPTAHISLPSNRKVSKLLEIVKAENRTECFSNHTVFQSLRICNDKLHIKIMFQKRNRISASPTSVSMTGHCDDTMEAGDVRQLSSTTGDYCCTLLSKQVACGSWQMRSGPTPSKQREKPHPATHTRVPTQKHSRSALCYSSCNQEEQKPPFPVMKHSKQSLRKVRETVVPADLQLWHKWMPKMEFK